MTAGEAAHGDAFLRVRDAVDAGLAGDPLVMLRALVGPKVADRIWDDEADAVASWLLVAASWDAAALVAGERCPYCQARIVDDGSCACSDR